MTGGGMAEFRLAPGRCGRAIRHRSVEEIWFVTEGAGEMWREGVNGGAPVTLAPGTCVSVPPRTAFQVRARDDGLAAVAITMPPWPGPEEAEVLQSRGPWVPDV